MPKYCGYFTLKDSETNPLATLSVFIHVVNNRSNGEIFFSNSFENGSKIIIRIKGKKEKESVKKKFLKE